MKAEGNRQFVLTWVGRVAFDEEGVGRAICPGCDEPITVYATGRSVGKAMVVDWKCRGCGARDGIGVKGVAAR